MKRKAIALLYLCAHQLSSTLFHIFLEWIARTFKRPENVSVSVSEDQSYPQRTCTELRTYFWLLYVYRIKIRTHLVSFIVLAGETGHHEFIILIESSFQFSFQITCPSFSDGCTIMWLRSFNQSAQSGCSRVAISASVRAITIEHTTCSSMADLSTRGP